MNASSRDHHFNQYVEAMAHGFDAPLDYRSRVVQAVKRLSQQQRNWQEHVKFLYSNLRT